MYGRRSGVRIYTRSLARARAGAGWELGSAVSWIVLVLAVLLLLSSLYVTGVFHVSRRVLACCPLVSVHHCTTPYYGLYHTALDLTSTATATASTSSYTSVPFALPIVRSVFSLRTYISPVCFFTTLPSSVSLAEFFSYCHHTTPPHTIQHSTAPSTSQPNQASIALTPALCACAHP